jgi:hypothetical protein
MLKSVKTAVPVDEPAYSTAYGGEPRGVLRAKVRVSVVDIRGILVTRSVSAGVDYNATLGEAKAAAESVRAANPNHNNIAVSWTVDL